MAYATIIRTGKQKSVSGGTYAVQLEEGGRKRLSEQEIISKAVQYMYIGIEFANDMQLQGHFIKYKLFEHLTYCLTPVK